MATTKDSGGWIAHECYYKCDSKKHASNLTAVVTRARLSDEKVAAYLKWCCIKYAEAVDSNGRSIVHVAAAKGRLKLLMYLLSHPNVNINFKDLESGFTALHRSLFYGQIHCAVRLVQLGANLQERDLDDLTPLNHVMKDQLTISSSNEKLPTEVYVWGRNTSYNLGIGHNNSRSLPAPLSFFSKRNISIKGVCMSKFHSIFIENDGKVWVCGLNSSGRLGLGSETTSLVPTILKIGNKASHSCKAVSIGINHSLLLMENGSVWSFGHNNYHQLGHYPCPEEILSPKQVESLKGIEIVGVSASKYYSVFWSKYLLYACGLNTGQLGNLKSSESIPQLVKKFTVKGLPFELHFNKKIDHVATCDGAVVLVAEQFAYLFQNYKYKKIRFEHPCLKVCIIGGHNENEVYTNSPVEKKEEEVKILMLCDDNKIYYWQESFPIFTVCTLSLRRSLSIADIHLNLTSIALTTNEGEAFFGQIKTNKNKFFSMTPDYSYKIILEKIPHIHRAGKIVSDLQGENFSVVQVHPKVGPLQFPPDGVSEMKESFRIFLNTTSENDSLHDVVFMVENVRFPAHRYIVSHSEVLRDMILNSECIENKIFVKIEKVRPKIFERILTYLYTGDCDLLHVGVCSISHNSVEIEIKDKYLENVTNPEEISAYEYHKQQTHLKKLNNSKQKNKVKNPLECFKEAATLFGLTDLIEVVKCLVYDNGYIRVDKLKKTKTLPPLKFQRETFQDLWDVSFKAEDGTVLKAHKCILVARLEYFNCMLNKRWLESYSKTPLNFPISSTIMEILFRYLYTNEVNELLDSSDTSLLCQVLVIADQFFCTGLKQMAEVSLQKVLTLKNAADMLQLAFTCNADLLKRCSMEYISLNLSEILEMRSLEILDDSILVELKDFYRSWLPCMTRRNITTSDDDPSDEFVDKIYSTEPVSFDKVNGEFMKTKPSVKTPKDKTQRKKKNSESEKVHTAIIAPLVTNEEVLLSESPKSQSVEATECTNKTNENTWIKVTSHNSRQAKCKPFRIQTTPSKTLSVVSAPLKTPPAATLSPKVLATMSPPISIPKPNAIRDAQPSALIKGDSLSNSEKDNNLYLSSSFEKDFPSLNYSPPERTPIVSPKSPVRVNFNFVKLSQKQKKKLAMQPINKIRMSSEKFINSKPVPAWTVIKPETDSMTDIIKREYQASKTSSTFSSSPTWHSPSSPPCSFSAIMAAERNERNLVAKMKSKPLEFTQMEEKAIDDLKLLYDVSNVTDEKITIRRAESVFISPPIWVSVHK